MQRTQGSLASTLIGNPVRNGAGETIGKIEELVIDPVTGRVLFGILSMDGISGMNSEYAKLVAVPWNALGLVPGRDYVLLQTDKNVLSNAPSFERNSWPDFGDPAWRTRVYGHYGQPDPAVIRERVEVVHHERPVPRKGMSVLAGAFLVLLVLGLAGFTYLVATRGWEQAKNEVIDSTQSVTYAMKEGSSDATLTAKVKTAMTLNKRVPAGDINVDSGDGIVTLRGEVNTDETRAIAAMVAADTPGVREVRNHLYVVQPSVK